MATGSPAVVVQTTSSALTKMLSYVKQLTSNCNSTWIVLGTTCQRTFLLGCLTCWWASCRTVRDASCASLSHMQAAISCLCIICMCRRSCAATQTHTCIDHQLICCCSTIWGLFQLCTGGSALQAPRSVLLRLHPRHCCCLQTLGSTWTSLLKSTWTTCAQLSGCQQSKGRRQHLTMHPVLKPGMSWNVSNCTFMIRCLLVPRTQSYRCEFGCGCHVCISAVTGVAPAALLL